MNKSLLALLTIAVLSLLAAPALAVRDLACIANTGTATSPCPSGYAALVRLSGTSDAHAELPSGTTYSTGICCTGSTISVTTPTPPASGGPASCTSGSPMLWLSGTSDAHAEAGNANVNYLYPICLTAPNAYSFSLVFNAATASTAAATPASPATCAGSLSATGDAHLGSCSAYGAAGTSGVRIAITAREDDTPPSGGSISYPNAYSVTTHTALNPLTISLSAGSDPETGIQSTQLSFRRAVLSSSNGRDPGTCGSYGSWSSTNLPSTDFSTTAASIPSAGQSTPFLDNSCYEFKYNVRNNAPAASPISETTTGYTSTNSYRIDTSPPLAGTIALPSPLPSTGGFTNATALALATTGGTDAHSGIESDRVEQSTATLTPGGCDAFGAWSSTANPVPLSTDTCAKYRLTTSNKAGGLASTAATGTVKADSTPPASTDNSDPTKTYGQTASFTITCQDSGSGCASYRVCEHPSGASPCDLASAQPILFPTTQTESQSVNSKSATKSITCPSGSTCSTIVRYASTDSAGNTEPARATQALSQNPNLPVCTFTAIPAYSRSPTVSLSWSSTDPLSVGIKNYIITARDTASGVPTSVTLTTTSGSLTLADAKTYDLTCEPVDNTDVRGSTGSTPRLTIDATPPSPALTLAPKYAGQARWVNDTFTVRWSGTDAGSGIASYAVESATAAAGTPATVFTLFATSTSSGGGSQDQTIVSGTNYSYRATATDAAGNTKTTEPAWLAADTAPPTCALPALPAITGSPGSVTLTPAASDALSGIASLLLEATTDNSTWSPLELDAGSATATFPDGAQPVFRCTATDAAGNRATSPLASTVIDTAGPSFNATLPSEVALGSTLTIRVEASDASGLSSFTLSNGTATLATLASPVARNASLTATTVAAPVGIRSFIATATDRNGNARTQTFTTTVSVCLLGQSKACGSNVGECRAGTQQCSAGSSGNEWGACTGQLAPATELCDAKDNDCDGAVDDSLTRAGLTKVIIAGACATAMDVCTAGAWTPAQGTPPAAFDTCGNNKDDDCNGVVDETCTCSPLPSTRDCGSTSVGACDLGTQTCTATGWSQCIGSIEPAAEQCGNAIDDNCDGVVDEQCSSSTLCANGPIPESGCSCGGRTYDYGYCTNGVFSTAPTGPAPAPDLFSSPWILLSVAGAFIVLILLILISHFKSKGKELSWGELQKQWG